MSRKKSVNFNKRFIQAMTRYTHILPLLFIFAATGLFSCKKKTNDNPFGSARIATVDVAHSGSILHYRVYYGIGNNVDSLIITGDGSSAGYHGIKAFSYFGSSYSITDQDNFTYTVYANTSGMILKLLIADTTSFIYNGTQLGEIDVRTTTPTYPFFTINATNYYWQSGDVVTVTGGGINKSYAYDQARNGQPGDPFRIDAFLNYGRSYIKTTHLPQSLSTGSGWLEKYYYTFNPSGLISQLIKVKNNNTVTADDSTFYNYTYY